MIIPKDIIIAMKNGVDDDLNKMKQIDDKYLEENDKYLYWNTLFMASRIKYAMEEECSKALPNTFNTLWYALRLKFTDDIIRSEAIEFLNGNINYSKEIYGYKIYDVMKEYLLAYPMALLKIYELNGGDNEFTLKRQIYDWQVPSRSEYKIANSMLENNKIKYLEVKLNAKTAEELEDEYEKRKKSIQERFEKYYKAKESE